MDAKLRLAVLAGLGLAHSAAFGLGLGNVEVVSHLNEPLEARIELLSTTSKELADAKVSIAPEADFSRVGLERSAFLNRLNFTIVSDTDQPYVQVTTQAPVQEPFLDFLVVVDFSAGKLLREYTLLLDPPVFTPGNTTAMQTSAAEPEDEYQQMDDGSTELNMDEDSSYSEPEPEYQAEANSEPTPEPTQQAETIDNQNDYGSSASLDDYTVQAGDTLWEIARDTKPTDSVTINQMMVALLRANPEAFYDDNINALKKGAVMRLPDGNEVNETSHADAVAMVRNQNAMWGNYRSEMAEQAPTVSDDSYSSSYDDSTSTYQESESHLELVPPKQSDDSVDTSVAQASGGYSADNSANTEELEDDLARSQEQLVAKDQEAAELRSRITDLEDLVDRLETAVSIKDSDLSELQNQLAGAQQAIEDAQAQANENMQQMAADSESNIDEITNQDEAATPTDSSEISENYNSEEIQPEDSNTEDMAENTDMAADDTETPAEEEYASQEGEFSFDDAENTENADTVDQESEQPVVEEEAAAEPQPPAEQPKGFMDWLTHPYAYGLYGLLAVLGLLGFMRSRKKDDDDSDIGAFAGELESEAEKAEESVENIIDDVDEALESGNEEVQQEVESLEDQAEDQAEILAEQLPDAPPELDFDTLDEAAEDISEAADEEEPAEFDLGDLYAEEETADDKQQSNDDSLDLDSSNESDDDGGLDFDLDMDLDLEDDDSQSNKNSSDDQDSEDAEQDQGISFDLESMIENEDDVASPEEEVELPTFAMDAETDNESDSEEPDSLEFNLEDDSFDLDLDDLETGLDDKTESSEEASEFDLEMTEDLTEVDEESEIEESADTKQDENPNDLEMEATSTDEEEIDEPPELDTDDLFAGEDAVATKLDLARAYMDMGDPDGARGMLEEVIAEGNDSQKSEAEQLLADI